MIPKKAFKLTKEEREIEKEIDQYVPVSPEKFKEMAEALVRRRKEAVLSIRINQQDLDSLKQKAKMYKVPYQSLIAEILHRHAT